MSKVFESVILTPQISIKSLWLTHTLKFHATYENKRKTFFSDEVNFLKQFEQHVS